MGVKRGLYGNQRKGVVGSILIMLLLLGYSFWEKHQKDTEADFERSEFLEAAFVQSFLDSLKENSLQVKPTFSPNPFNPNFISDHKGYTLGMTTEEIDRLHRFREEEKWINSIAEFQKVTGVSDSLLTAISPLFKFPDWVVESQTKTNTKSFTTPSKSALTFAQKRDLNTTTQEELMEISGIGEVLSKRIIHYRSQLGGFKDDIQLKDIYGLNYETRERLLKRFTVKSKEENPLIDLNLATVVELLEVPYIDYELARKIVDYRLTHEGISNYDQLAEIERFPYDRLDRIKLYVKINNP